MELDSIVQALGDRRDELVDTLLEEIVRELSIMGDDPRTLELLRASVTENVLMALHFISNDTDPDTLVAPTAAIDQARTLAQRDVPVSLLMRSYRLGHARFLDVALRLVRDLGAEDGLGIATRLVQRAATFIDTISEQVIEAYQDERDQWVRRDVWLRRQHVDDLLADRGADLAVAERQLGYRLDARHLAIIAWPQETVPASEVPEVLDGARRVVEDAFGATGRLLAVPKDERETWVWVSPRRSPDDLAKALTNAGVDARLAVGSLGRGVAGFRSSLDDALGVRAVMMASGHQALTFDEVAVPSLMAGDLPRLRRFVAATLQKLADDDERVTPLRDTLRAYLGHHRSIVATANALTLHRNSVRYRIDRAVELWGGDLDEPGESFRLATALEAAHWLGLQDGSGRS